jgi:hypothetical protein
MHSSVINKIEKAHRYAQQPERIRIDGMSATFHGDHDEYRITLEDGRWACTCHTFESRAIGDTCSHVMAMQQILGDLLCEPARFWSPQPEPAVEE